MDHPNNTDANRQDLPLDFDTAPATPAPASVSRPDAEPAKPAETVLPPAPPPQSAMATETSMIRRPTPIITGNRRPDSLTTQTIPEDIRVRTIPASAFPGTVRNQDTKPPSVPFGRYLAEQRKRLNLTLQQVDDATLIRHDYLEFLEQEALDKLPPPVYVIAYVRKLGVFYKIPTQKVEELVGELKRNLEYSVPETLLNQLEINTEPCEENTRTMRRILWILGIAVPVLIGLLLLIIFFTAGRSSQAPADVPAGNRMPESRLDFLLEKPVFALPELPGR